MTAISRRALVSGAGAVTAALALDHLVDIPAAKASSPPAGKQAPGFYRAKLGTARFYAEHILPQAHGLKQEVVHGSTSTLALEEAQF